MAEGTGDILCFFPGERDIRDAMKAIEGRRWRGVEATPLFGRLSNQEQHRVFSPHSGRRIVLATVAILFGLQSRTILDRPAIIALIAVPILIQSYLIFAIGYGAAWLMRVPHRIAAPCAMIGTSNFFELAVAVAISLFGLNSGAALATASSKKLEVPIVAQGAAIRCGTFIVQAAA